MVGQKYLHLESQGTSCFVNSTINALFSLPFVFSFLTERSVTPCLKAGRGALFLELMRLTRWQGSRPANSDMVRQLANICNDFFFIVDLQNEPKWRVQLAYGDGHCPVFPAECWYVALRMFVQAPEHSYRDGLWPAAKAVGPPEYRIICESTQVKFAH